MDKNEFFERLSMTDCECMILDDSVINPCEIVLYTSKKRNLIRKIKESGLPCVIQERGLNRYLRVKSYKEEGLAKWRKKLEEYAQESNGKIKILNEEDGNALFLHYAFVCVQTKNWLYYNILEVLIERLNLSNETDLKRWLAAYIKKKNFEIKVKRIVELPLELYGLLSPLEKNITRANQVRLKVIRKLGFKRLWLNSTLHHFFTRKSYLKYLEKTSVVGECWSLINEGGASASTFIKDIRERKTYFIKGNELSKYRGIRNEISIQNRIFQLSDDQSWFLPMLACDDSCRWIRYEYVEWPLLKQYIEKEKLESKELEALGEYLIETLDKLYAMKIVHNDLRGENIMVRVGETGTFEGFVLIDFGCSSYEGAVPWESKTYLGKYMEKAICGEKRYNENLIDDAASAFLVYLSAGGNANDSYAMRIRQKIGRINFSVNTF